MATFTLLGDTPGPSASVGDATPICLGVEFQVIEDCDVTAVRWWQPTTGASTASRTVGIFPATGAATVLATASAAPTGSGWQRVALTEPLSLTPGYYRAVVLMPAGQYAATPGWWLGSGAGGTGPGADGITSGPIHGPNSTSAQGAGGQQSFIESATLQRTTQGFGNASYWIDVEVTDGEDTGTPLDTPVVALGATSHPTTHGSTDGSQIVTWDPVPSATGYTAWLAAGSTPGQEDFAQVAEAVTSPHTFTGLAAGTWSFGIRAEP